MKKRWVGIMSFLLILVIWWSFPKGELQQSWSPGLGESSNDPSNSTESENKSKASEEESATSDATSELDELESQVKKLSMLDQNSLAKLREKAVALLNEDNKGFELYTVQMVEEADKNSLESIFFFVETFVKNHPDPSEGMEEIFKQESMSVSQNGEMSAGKKQNMAKALAMEALFDRYESDPGQSQENLQKLETSIKELVQHSQDPQMVRQALLVLKSKYDDQADQLQELTRKRADQDDPAYSELLKSPQSMGE